MSYYAPGVYYSSTAAQAQQQAELEAARRQSMNSQQMLKAELIVPTDAYPGKSVRIQVYGKDFMVVIPPNVRPGQKILVQVPYVVPPVVTAAAPVAPSHNHHHSVPQQIPPPPPPPPQNSYANSVPYAEYANPLSEPGMQAPPRPSRPTSMYNMPSAPTTTTMTTPYNPASVSAPSAPSYAPDTSAPPMNPSSISESGRLAFNQALSAQSLSLLVNKNHLIQPENAASYSEHNIISVYEGETVLLIDGDLERGLPSPYQDYVTVRTDDGRTGKVAKGALQPK